MMTTVKALLFLTFIAVGLCDDSNDLFGPKNTTEITPCMCGVFLNGQFKRGSLPKDQPILMHEHEENLMCNSVGNKQCTNKCLEAFVRHLSNSPTIICGSVDRDLHKERAYLFIKNCSDKWINTNLSAGREYCCKDGVPYKCN